MNDAEKVGIVALVGVVLAGAAYLVYRGLAGGTAAVSSAKVTQTAPGGNALALAVSALPVISSTATSLASLGAASNVFGLSSSGSGSLSSSSGAFSADDAGDDSVSDGD
jgi:hypothetical protein